jgi:hypothetical protein
MSVDDKKVYLLRHECITNWKVSQSQDFNSLDDAMTVVDEDLVWNETELSDEEKTDEYFDVVDVETNKYLGELIR